MSRVFVKRVPLASGVGFKNILGMGGSTDVEERTTAVGSTGIGERIAEAPVFVVDSHADYCMNEFLVPAFLKLSRGVDNGLLVFDFGLEQPHSSDDTGGDGNAVGGGHVGVAEELPPESPLPGPLST